MNIATQPASGRFAGKTAVITGGGGIGKATAERLAAEGAAVAVLDLDVDTAEKAIRGLPGPARAYAVDVTDANQVEAAVARIEEELGPFSLAVAGAGVITTSPLLDIDLAAWRRTIDVNLTGTFLTIRAAAHQMLRHGLTGSIVAIASVAARRGQPLAADYAASKAGVISLVRSAALALAPTITVNAVSPGVVDTAMTEAIHRDRGRLADTDHEHTLADMLQLVPLQRIQTPEDVAAVIAFLLSPDSSYITGQAINNDGGMAH